MLTNVSYQSVYQSIYLSLSVVQQPLWALAAFFSFLIHTQSIVLLGRGISPSQGRYLHIEQHKHRINAHRHVRLE
jgi:hypothetical protein